MEFHNGVPKLPLAEYQKLTLLTPQKSNPKTAKGFNLPYHSAIMHLAPFNHSGYMVCPFASGNLQTDELPGSGCVFACLNDSGHGAIGGVNGVCQQCRIRRTRYYFQYRSEFMAHLAREISALVRAAHKRNKKPALRLNGTSDIPWETTPLVRANVRFANVFVAYPDVIFYDYTKIPKRIMLSVPNYHLTFSLSESNDAHALRALRHGLNVATVLRIADHESMPDTFSGYPLIDGTEHDFRFLDNVNHTGSLIVGLRPKGKAKKDKSGFVKSLDYQFDASRTPLLAVAHLHKTVRVDTENIA